MVRFVVPLKVVPFRKKVGLTAVTFPPKAEEGPRVRFPVPVRVRLCGVAPVWVNCRRDRVPAEKPPAPMLMLLPPAKVLVAVAPPPNWTPAPFVDVTTILLLKIVPAEFWLTKIAVLPVGVLLKVAIPPKILFALLYATNRLLLPVLLKVDAALN